MPLLRDGLVEAETLVDIRGVVPRGRRRGTTIGAGTTLAELEADPEVPEALREACRLAASPQLRSMGTIGGNLLQATRCWYWRLKFPCFLHGGDVCHARQGEHREHAIFGNERCASAHPSDPAAALLALGARLRTDRRELALAELYRLPTDDDRSTTTLEPGELILELDVPRPEASTYLKAMDRAALGVPARRRRRGSRPRDDVRLALAGVAPIPWAARLAGRARVRDAPSGHGVQGRARPRADPPRARSCRLASPSGRWCSPLERRRGSGRPSKRSCSSPCSSACGRAPSTACSSSSARTRSTTQRTGRHVSRLGARAGRFTALRPAGARRAGRGRGGRPRRRAEPLAGGRRPRDRGLALGRRAGRRGHVRRHAGCTPYCSRGPSGAGSRTRAPAPSTPSSFRATI